MGNSLSKQRRHRPGLQDLFETGLLDSQIQTKITDQLSFPDLASLAAVSKQARQFAIHRSTLYHRSLADELGISAKDIRHPSFVGLVYGLQQHRNGLRTLTLRQINGDEEGKVLKKLRKRCLEKVMADNAAFFFLTRVSSSFLDSGRLVHVVPELTTEMAVWFVFDDQEIMLQKWELDLEHVYKTGYGFITGKAAITIQSQHYLALLFPECDADNIMIPGGKTGLMLYRNGEQVSWFEEDFTCTVDTHLQWWTMSDDEPVLCVAARHCLYFYSPTAKLGQHASKATFPTCQRAFYTEQTKRGLSIRLVISKNAALRTISLSRSGKVKVKNEELPSPICSTWTPSILNSGSQFLILASREHQTELHSRNLSTDACPLRLRFFQLKSKCWTLAYTFLLPEHDHTPLSLDRWIPSSVGEEGLRVEDFVTGAPWISASRHNYAPPLLN